MRPRLAIIIKARFTRIHAAKSRSLAGVTTARVTINTKVRRHWPRRRVRVSGVGYCGARAVNARPRVCFRLCSATTLRRSLDATHLPRTHTRARGPAGVSRLHIIIPHGYSSSNPELCLQLDYRVRSPLSLSLSLIRIPLFHHHARVLRVAPLPPAQLIVAFLFSSRFYRCSCSSPPHFYHHTRRL